MRLRALAEHIRMSHRPLFVLLIVLLLSNLLLFAALDQYIVPQVAEQEGRFLQRQNEVRQLLHNQSGVARAPEQHYVQASHDLSQFYEAIPEYQEFTSLIEELLVLSNRAQLDIAQISYASAELKELPLLKFNLSFNVAGEYAQLKKFIHSLEQSSRLVTIKQIGLAGTDEDGVNLRLNLETFFRPGSREP